MSKRNVFARVRALRPKRSVFDLSYEKKFTCDMGQLIPVMCDELVPGDFFKIGNQSVIRLQPLVAPFLHEVNQYVHYFFVPYRLLWGVDWDPEETGSWEEYITGGVDGLNADPIPEWAPTDTTVGSLWDFIGFPTGVDPGAGQRPVDWPRRAYNFIYNEYYRDENLITEVAGTNETILQRCWEKDYFTSALLEQQRGTAVAMPISGTDATSAVWDDATIANSGTGVKTLTVTEAGAADPVIRINSVNGAINALGAFNDNTVTVDFSNATTFDIADLRLAIQTQKWQERNNRAGVRYIEFLLAHHGEAPNDERLQRPEYIGGSKTPIIVSEVLQTSETATTPQGTLAGHGISISDSYCGKYHAKEYGLIMGIMSVMPRTAYQQGINRQWLKPSRFEYFFPEFVNLSEQAITNNEIYSANANPVQNAAIFGYQGRYDEMRTKQNMVCSEMRSTFDYWHLGRQFGALPVLNGTFVTCVPDKRIFADEADPGLIVSFANIIKAVRPIPISAEPGLMDHN